MEENIDRNIGLMEMVPKLNMHFESEPEPYWFYNKYAGTVGFSVPKDFKNKSKIDGHVVSQRFLCYKSGFRQVDKRYVEVKRPQKQVRTGCLAQMTIARQSDGKYKVTYFEKNHNHELVPPEQAHMLPSQRKVTLAQAIEVNMADDSGIPQKSAFEFMSRQVGGR